MSRSTLSVSVALAAALLITGCGSGDDATETQPVNTPTPQPAEGSAEPGTPEPLLEQGADRIRGSFSMIEMAHTRPYAGAELQEQQPNPWNGQAGGGGPYRYAAIPCTDNAPVNNISGDLPTFNTLVPGSRVPASTRAHPLEFQVSEGDGGQMQLEGTLELTVCQLRPGVTPKPDPVPDPEKDRIRFEWTAQAVQAGPESVVWEGTFDIVGGTGPYEQLTGEGTMAGYFFCFAPEGCTEIGEYRDLQFTMAGDYEVPREALEQAGS
jgi:hypothetical protein